MNKTTEPCELCHSQYNNTEYGIRLMCTLPDRHKGPHAGLPTKWRWYHSGDAWVETDKGPEDHEQYLRDKEPVLPRPNVNAEPRTVLASDLTGHEIGKHVTFMSYVSYSYPTIGGILRQFTIPEYDDGSGVSIKLESDETTHLLSRMQEIEVWE